MRMLRESDRGLAARQLDNVPSAGAQVGLVPQAGSARDATVSAVARQAKHARLSTHNRC
jgi:hypothetical protein